MAHTRDETRNLKNALPSLCSLFSLYSQADYLRALERISQKHKGGGKWNKNILHKNIKDPEVCVLEQDLLFLISPYLTRVCVVT